MSLARNLANYIRGISVDNSSGNVGIGTSAPSTALDITSANTNVANFNGTGANGSAIKLQSSGTNVLFMGSSKYITGGSASEYGIGTAGATPVFFATNGTERARIDSSGYLLVNKTSATIYSGIYAQTYTTNSSGQKWVSVFDSTVAATSCQGLIVKYSAAVPNSTANEFLYCGDQTNLRFAIRSNGGIANYSANNVNLSDQRTKTDIQDAGGYLAKICAIPVRTFKYKDQTDDLLNLGVIAQEVEAVAPELVDVTGFGETPEDGVPLRSIYQTDMQYALMKCIQEQQAIIEQLRADVDALRGEKSPSA